MTRRPRKPVDLTREADIARAFDADMERLGCWSLANVVERGRRGGVTGLGEGSPDRLVIVPQRGVLWVELKHDADVSDEQRAFLARLDALGERGMVARGYGGVAEVVRAVVAMRGG